MATRGWGLTHPGKTRQSNEDSFLIDEELGLYGVADGITDRAVGKFSSEMALSTVQKILKENIRSFERLKKRPSVDARAKLEEALHHAVETSGFQLHSLSLSDPTKRGIATTIDLVWVVGDTALLAHVGNGRIYLLRGNDIHLLTEDHTVGREIGVKSPFARALSRSLGNRESVAIDTLQIELSRGDRFLICTDGLSKSLASHEILHRVKGAGEFAGASDSLIRLALERETTDNVTVICLQASPSSPLAEGEVEAQEKAEIVKQVPLFRYLNYQEVTKMLAIADRMNADAKTVLIQEGAKGKDLYVVLRGSVEITKGSVQVATRGPGSLFGEMSVIDDSPRSASVVTMESSALLKIEREDLFDLLKKESNLAVKFFWALCQDLNLRLRSTTEQLAKFKSEKPPHPPIPAEGPFEIELDLEE